MIYNALASRQAEEIDIHVSYMEIYQEVGYDLLTPAARLGTIVTSFPKVLSMFICAVVMVMEKFLIYCSSSIRFLITKM